MPSALDARSTVRDRIDLGEGLSAVHWRLEGRGTIAYVRPSHHTLSVYLEGGTRVRLAGGEQLNAAAARGGPGRLCILPAGHESAWFNDAPMSMLHVYVDRHRLDALTGGSGADLQSRVFHHDPAVAGLATALGSWHDWRAPSERLGVEHGVLALVARMHALPIGTREPRAGLPADRLRAIDELLKARMDVPPTLAELAAVAELGERQFLRALRASTGTTPGRHQMALRIDRAKRLIRASVPLADVALDCGFASQSHFGARFREHVGCTPGEWRRG